MNHKKSALNFKPERFKKHLTPKGLRPFLAKKTLQISRF
jgi:hypothetical protein